jgi:ABC-type dipeptide/oligopeptide/nickel transport system permease subunit
LGQPAVVIVGNASYLRPARNADQAEKSNWPLVWPSVALFVTVLCLALIGDGLPSALDPRGEG